MQAAHYVKHHAFQALPNYAVCSPSITASGCSTAIEANNYETDRHRRQLVTGVAGSPLSSYFSELQLLKGLRSCLEAHRILSDQDALHEDISPETVLLYDSAGMYGDIDGILRHVAIHQRPSVIVVATHLGSPERRGSSQYMATELLSNIVYEHVTVTRTPSHDVESFVWVLDCVMMKRMLRTVSTEQKFILWKDQFLKQSFKDIFGQVKIDQIHPSSIQCTVDTPHVDTHG